MLVEIIGSPRNVNLWLNNGGIKSAIPSKIKHPKDNMHFKLFVQGDDIFAKDEGMGYWPSFAGQIEKIRKSAGEIEKDINEIAFDFNKDVLWMAGTANANVVDHYEERVEPAGLDDSVFKTNNILLGDHAYINDRALGLVPKFWPEADGIKFEAWVGDPGLGPLTTYQQTVRTLIVQKILKTVSIGFLPKKIKAPLFNDEGDKIENAVIEQWLQLELTVTPVPANAGSLFEAKRFCKYLEGFAKSWQNDNVEKSENGIITLSRFQY
jgi:hypothetical protein